MTKVSGFISSGKSFNVGKNCAKSSIRKIKKLARLMKQLQTNGANIGNSIRGILLRESILNECFEDHSYYFVLDNQVFPGDVECERKQL